MSDKIHDVLVEKSTRTLFHGFTYSGHPTACAIALKNIEIIENEQLVQNSQEMGVEIAEQLKLLEEKHWTVAGGRNIGLLAAFELYKDRDTQTRFDSSLAVSQKVLQECLNRKLILRSITYESTDIIALAPPLIITKEEIRNMFSIISDSILAVENELKKQGY